MSVHNILLWKNSETAGNPPSTIKLQTYLVDRIISPDSKKIWCVWGIKLRSIVLIFRLISLLIREIRLQEFLRKLVNRDSHITSLPVLQSSFFEGACCLISASSQRKLRGCIEIWKGPLTVKKIQNFKLISNLDICRVSGIA